MENIDTPLQTDVMNSYGDINKHEKEGGRQNKGLELR